MNDMIKSKLVALEAKLDAKLFATYRGPDGRYYQDDEGSALGTGLKVGAAGAAVGGAGYGAFRADQAIMGRYGQRNLLPLGSMEPGSPRSISTRSAAPANVAPGSLQTGVSRRAAYGQAFTDAKNTAMSKGQQGLQAGKQAFRAGAAEVGNTTNVFTRLRRALRVGARVATGGRIG
jgi:hypothetical protein